MAHYRNLLDPGVFLGPQDFPAEGKPVTISRVVREALPERDGEKASTAPMLYIKTKDGGEYARKFKVPKTVLYGLSELLGPDHELWAGKEIVLFATKCMSFGEVEECVRVKFPADIEGKIKKRLKKRKTNPDCYILRDRN